MSLDSDERDQSSEVRVTSVRRPRKSVLSMLLFSEPRSYLLDAVHYFTVIFEVYLIFYSSRFTAEKSRAYCLSEKECQQYMRYSCGQPNSNCLNYGAQWVKNYLPFFYWEGKDD